MKTPLTDPRGSKLSSTQWREIYLGVALTTMATLLLELSLTRIFSVVFYYHFAFLAISIALFGMGIGGVLSYFTAGGEKLFFFRPGGGRGGNNPPVVGGAGRVFRGGGAPPPG